MAGLLILDKAVPIAITSSVQKGKEEKHHDKFQTFFHCPKAMIIIIQIWAVESVFLNEYRLCFNEINVQVNYYSGQSVRIEVRVAAL